MTMFPLKQKRSSLNSKTLRKRKERNNEESNMNGNGTNRDNKEDSNNFFSLRMLVTGPIYCLGAYIVCNFAYIIFTRVIRTPDLPPINMNEYWGSYPMDPKPDLSIRPFKIEFSDVMVNDLRERLLHQRPFIPPIENSGSKYGINSNFLAQVLDFWKNKYNFKQRESFFNKYNHYITKIQGLDIHYMHVEPVVSPDVKVVTLLMLHSWPASVREFYEIIPKLTTKNPKYDFVFEVIAPSLPGFGFSQATPHPNMNPAAMAIVVSNLMDRLGRGGYYVCGGDVGRAVAAALATLFPDHVLGFHTNTPQLIDHPLAVAHTALACYVPQLMEPQFEERMCPAESYLWKLAQRNYIHTHGNTPDTLGIGLTDSPAGLAAYILDTFARLTNPDGKKAEDGELRNKFSLTQLLDNVMVYWATNTITTSMRVHHEALRQNYVFNYDLIPTYVPAWGIKFKHNPIYTPDLHLRLKYKNYLHTTVVEEGGMFAAMENPDILANDIFKAVDTFIAFHASKQRKTKPEPAETSSERPTTIYDFTATSITGEDVDLGAYRGHVALVVNVASQCGLTDKNYEQLNVLYEKYRAAGLRILAFPCNQFGAQEPGGWSDIAHFTKHRGVEFDVFAKVEVNGDNAHPLWKFLKTTQSGALGDWIKWNFSKFLVNRQGVPVERFGPNVDPLELEPYIIKYLKDK